MNRLQLYISKSTGDFKTLVDINGSSDSRNALSDMRSVVGAVDYQASAKTVFYAVVNVRGGYMIHVLRTIPPVRPYHLDATIFVPAGIDVMAEQLDDVLAEVTEKVMASAVTEDDMAQLREIFAREYDDRDRKVRVKPSACLKPAVMYYDNAGGRRTLSDIIDEGLYRPEWSDYKAVLLLGDDLAVMAGAAVDLDAEDDDDDDGGEELESAPEPCEKPDRQSKGRRADDATYNYIFGLPMETPDGHTTLEFEVECSRPITRSPIQGYGIKGRVSDNPETVNRLRRISAGAAVSWFGKLKWFGIGLVAGIILMAIVRLVSSDGEANLEAAPTTPPVEQTQTAKQSKAGDVSAKPSKSNEEPVRKDHTESAEAIRYLDAHRVWNRDDMEKIDDLKGLYDDLNNFNLEQLAGEWASKLGGSKNFRFVAKAARQSISKKVDARRDAEHNPTYNRQGDNRINYQAYSYWIDP